MSGFAPGDVVVCVDDSIRVSPAHSGFGYERVVRGRVYRVIAVSFCHDALGDFWGCILDIDADDGGVWECDRFRKIDAATDEFTEQMRALRPVRAPLQAGCR